MATVIDSIIQSQLFDRRSKLEHAIADHGDNAVLQRLLHDVGETLIRIGDGRFGICKVCQSEIEPDRLMANPLAQFCLGDLTPREQQMLEKDLEMAALIQQSLLPKPGHNSTNWRIS